MNAHELLESLSLLDENERIEAKRAQDAGKSMLETICAFANEPQLGGGWLLLGVVPDEQALFPGYAVEGVANPDKLSADLASQCASTFNTPLRVEIRTESLQGKPVVVVRVPEASAQEKPVYFKATGLPRRHTAIIRASSASSREGVGFIDQPTTLRAKRSITTARYRQPCQVRSRVRGRA